MLALKQIYGFRQGRVAARRYAKEQAALRNRLSKGFQKKLDTVFNKAVRVVAQQVKDSEDPSYSSITRMIGSELDSVLKAQVRKTFDAVYSYNNDKYKKIAQKADGFDFGRSDRFESSVNQYFKGRQPMFSQISRSYGERILDEVSELRAADNNLDQIARSLTKTFQPINRKRAAVIARTETHGAQSFANDEYHRQVSDSFGVRMVKQWVSTADARTRRSHGLMNGETAQMDEDFFMPNGSRMSYAGDPRGGAANVVNCRCVILYIDSDDEVEDGAIADNIDDAQENADGLKVDEKGRPVGLTQDEFDRMYEGQDIEKLGKLSHSQMGKRFRDSMDGTWSEDGWLPFRSERLYSGRKSSQYGKISSGLKPTSSTTPSFNTGVAQLREVHKEIDQLADSFGIPRTRGFIASRGNSIANMGDGVMGWSKKWVAHFGMRKKEVASSWKKGDAARDRPFNAISYFEDRMDQMRTVAYHEFGHQIHQLYGLNKGKGTYRMPTVESRIRGQRVTGGPSRYSQSNSKEWFAENFAMWAMRREDLVDSDFIELIEDLLEGASG